MNIVNCSGGKDSVAMLLMMLERGIRVDRILYADVGEMAEFEEMYAYIAHLETHIGQPIETVRSDRWTARSIGSLRQLYLHFPKEWAQLRQLKADQGRAFKYGYLAEHLECRFQREQMAKEQEILCVGGKACQLTLAGFENALRKIDLFKEK